ncbi:AMP-binding protein, partial [Bacillus sp. SIMBA_154]|uniref:AMP-binding protein n=1 Tax=Bacillus sp. SIMBA_154 TaxID=3080859 RepID=UPI003979516F
TFQAAENEDGITGMISYAAALYKQETAERMAKQFIQLIEEIANDPQAPLSSLEMITAKEKEQIVERWGQPAIDSPRDKTIHQLFEEQAERTPEHTAAVYEKSRFTYRELNERANRLARILRSEGVQPDQPVGILA